MEPDRSHTRLILATGPSAVSFGALVGRAISAPDDQGSAIALGGLIRLLLATAFTRLFLSAATSLFRFTLNEERNQQILQQYVVPTATVLAIVVTLACLVGLVIPTGESAAGLADEDQKGLDTLLCQIYTEAFDLTDTYVNDGSGKSEPLYESSNATTLRSWFFTGVQVLRLPSNPNKELNQPISTIRLTSGTILDDRREVQNRIRRGVGRSFTYECATGQRRTIRIVKYEVEYSASSGLYGGDFVHIMIVPLRVRVSDVSGVDTMNRGITSGGQ